MIVIIDYGLGNVTSIQNALKRVGYTSTLSDQPADLRKSLGLILPGVGAFPEAMKQIKKKRLVEKIREEVLINNKPILGICLGMQILAETGEENGRSEGLGLIPGKVQKINYSKKGKVPHVGWSSLCLRKRIDKIFLKTNCTDSFYFDHSYKFSTHKKYISATVAWNGEITAAVSHQNIYGTQFHPEKSQIAGLRILKAFCDFAVIQKR